MRLEHEMHRPLFLFSVLAIAATSACTAAPVEDLPTAGAAQETFAFDALTSDAVDLVDLTHNLSPDSIYWPTGSPFVHEVLDWGTSEGGYWYASAAFSSPEHLGTHLDAPVHFGEGGWTSAEIPIDRLVAPGILIDISEKAAADADATLGSEEIEAWEALHGPVPAGSVVIVRTGWAHRWPDWNRYYGTDTPEDVGTLHFPGVSPAAARALLSRDIFGVGIDTASLDPGTSTTFEAHQILAGGNIFNLENLTNVQDLPARDFGVIALPMKIENGTGGPTRVVAVVAR